MSCFEITEDDFDDMHHALGRPDLETLREGENYRNYYATEAGSAWALRAEQTGLWDRITRQGERLVTYRVNSDGKSMLADWLSLKSRPQSPSDGSETTKTGNSGTNTSSLLTPPLEQE